MTALPLPLAGQGFAATFKSAVDKIDEIKGDLTNRRRVARATEQQLDRAEAAIDGYSDGAQRRAQLHFFIGVRRVEVLLRVDTEQTRRRATTLGRATRREAFAKNVYKTYYRAVLLIALSRTMPEHEFLAMLDDELKDGEYLRGEASGRDVATMREGLSIYAGYLSLLRAWIDLTRRPIRAVNELRELGKELKQFGDGAKSLRDEVYSRLAWHFMALRDFDRAKLYLDEVPREDSRYPRAMIDYKQGNFEFCAAEAERLYREDKRPGYALLLGDARERLAQEARSNQDSAKAERLLASALLNYGEAILGAKQRNDRQKLAAACNGQGDCYLALGKLGAAQTSYRSVLATLEGKTSWTERAERAETLKDLGRLAERRNAPAEALEDFLKSLTEVEEIREGIPFDALGIAWLEPGQLEAVDGVLRLATSGHVTPARALATVDRMKARGLLDWMRSPPSYGDLDDYRIALADLAKARSAVEVRKYGLALDAYRARRAREQADPLSAIELRDLVGGMDDTAFLSYWTGKILDRPRIYLVFAKGSLVEVFDLGDARVGQQRYAAALAAVRRPAGDPWSSLDAAAAFFLPPDVRDRIRAGQRVVICPDGEMGDLPFEALRIRNVPLGVRNVVYRTPSLSVLRELRRRRPRAGRALIFDSAEPSSSDRRLHGLSDLEFSKAEGDLVCRAYPANERRSGKRATYEELRAALNESDFRLLHVSCHAISDPRIPSASLLMLTGEPLDMGTLATMKMDDMLVVFSSCHSRGTVKVGGEGVKGLLWGPLAAKARAVIASQWAVNQRATKDLMGQFYYHLARGDDEGEAMRRARRTLSRTVDYAHPSYWAGFSVFAAPPASASAGVVAPAVPPTESRGGAGGDAWVYGLLGMGVILLGVAVWGLTRRKTRIDVPL